MGIFCSWCFNDESLLPREYVKDFEEGRLRLKVAKRYVTHILGVSENEDFTSICRSELPSIYEHLSGTILEQTGDKLCQALSEINKCNYYGIPMRYTDSQITFGDESTFSKLLWKLFHIFLFPKETGSQSKKAVLLEWVNSQVDDYEELSATNYGDSFKDGRVFCALAHCYSVMKDDSCGSFVYSTVRKSQKLKNCEMAFKFFERHGIPRVLERDDMKVLDEKSISLYVALIYQLFTAEPETEPLKKEGDKVTEDLIAVKTTIN